VRAVPVHLVIAPLVQRLMSAASDLWLHPRGLLSTCGRDARRSAGAAKRFTKQGVRCQVVYSIWQRTAVTANSNMSDQWWGAPLALRNVFTMSYSVPPNPLARFSRLFLPVGEFGIVFSVSISARILRAESNNFQ
jgi:hypothetical protein